MIKYFANQLSPMFLLMFCVSAHSQPASSHLQTGKTSPIASPSVSNAVANREQPAEQEPDSEEDERRETDPDNLFYRSPDERREAGMGHRINDWLTISGLLEIEREQIRARLKDNQVVREKERPVKTLQLGFDIALYDAVEIQLILETEDAEHSSSKVDEFILAWDWQNFGLYAGIMSPDFGEYYSHLVLGPMLEFGETRAATVGIDYALSDNLQVGLFWIESQIDQQQDIDKTDWGALVEWQNSNESMRFGLSYMSDIAKSDENFLQDFNQRSLRQVDAWNAHGFVGFEQFEITAELVKTLDHFSEFEPDFDRPQAYNLELAYYLADKLQLAIRYERSKELLESPPKRIGLGVRWLVLENVSIALDYLRGHYATNGTIPVDDEPDELAPVTDEHLLAAQLSVAF